MKIIKRLFSVYKRRHNLRRLCDLQRSGLPPQVVPAIKYLINGKCDKDTLNVISRAERRRKEIADEGDRKVPILYSPKPKDSPNGAETNARPQPGKILEFTMTRVARTGKDYQWGTCLYLLIRESNAATGIELGSCAGISAMYLSSAPNLKRFLTVEGSSELAKIAADSLRNRPNVKVVNSLFDEAIDSELVQGHGDKIDFAFIDGHHEKTATIHYFNRLLPFLNKEAVVVFDDICWSPDMRAAWLDLSQRRELSHAIDLRKIGVCVLAPDNSPRTETPTYWDLQVILGHEPMGNPTGWKE